ncbi:MAG: hypothetical protein NW237_01680 [Cyanobacteriota bacterium]|nr:hypothetical protein [Cyanobacteriota bacterium]
MPITPDFTFPFEQQQKASLHNPTVVSQGLAKREFFVALTLQAILSNPQVSPAQFADPEQRQILISTAILLADETLQAMQGLVAVAEETDAAYAAN